MEITVIFECHAGVKDLQVHINEPDLVISSAEEVCMYIYILKKNESCIYSLATISLFVCVLFPFVISLLYCLASLSQVWSINFIALINS